MFCICPAGVHTPKAFLNLDQITTYLTPSFSFLFSIDLSLLSRIPGRPYKEPVEIKVERDDSLDRDGKDCSKQSSEKSSSKAKRKHKVWDLIEQTPVCVLCRFDSSPIQYIVF